MLHQTYKDMHCCELFQCNVSVILHNSIKISELNDYEKYLLTLNCEKQATGPCYLKTTQISSDEF